MSQSFNTTPLPLDIPNSTLFGDKGDDLMRVLDDIGIGGWDKNTRKFSVSFMRARAKLSLIREEIMQLALNTKRRVVVEELLYVGNDG